MLAKFPSRGRRAIAQDNKPSGCSSRWARGTQDDGSAGALKVMSALGVLTIVAGALEIVTAPKIIATLRALMTMAALRALTIMAALRALEKAIALKIMVAQTALRSALKIPAALVALTVMAALRALMAMVALKVLRIMSALRALEIITAPKIIAELRALMTMAALRVPTIMAALRALEIVAALVRSRSLCAEAVQGHCGPEGAHYRAPLRTLDMCSAGALKIVVVSVNSNQ